MLSSEDVLGSRSPVPWEGTVISNPRAAPLPDSTYGSEPQLRASSGLSVPCPAGDYQRVTWEKKAPRLCGVLGRERRQLLSLAGAHRLDAGGNAAKKQRREAAGTKRGDWNIPLKIKIIPASSTDPRGSSLTGTYRDAVGILVTPGVMLGCRPAPRFALLRCRGSPLPSPPAPSCLPRASPQQPET